MMLGNSELATPFSKGGGKMISMFEAMYLMIAFATLIVMIMKKK